MLDWLRAGREREDLAHGKELAVCALMANTKRGYLEEMHLQIENHE